MSTRSTPRRCLPRLEPLEARETPATLFDNGQIAVVAENRAGIVEPPVPVYFRGEPRGTCNVVEGYQRVGRSGFFPLSRVDVVASGYSRLSYQKADGSSAALGTSLVVGPSFRDADGLHLIPTVQRVDVDVASNVVTVRLTATFGALATQVVTVRHVPAALGRTVTTVSARFTTLNDLTLDATAHGNDALRLFTVSTMYAGSGWDTSDVQFRDAHGAVQRLAAGDLPGDQHLFAAPSPLASTGAFVTAVKQPGSTWFPDSPTVGVGLTSATLTLPGGTPERLAVGLQGWRQESSDPNDDSLSLWLEVLAAPATLPAGAQLDVLYQVTATPPQALPAAPAAPVLLGPRGVAPTLRPTFTWSAMLGADAYDLLLSRLTPAARPVLYHAGLSEATFTPTTPLPQGLYRVRVRAVRDGQAGGWSAPLTFRIDVPTPARPVLTGPVGATSTTPTFTWSPAAHAVAYDLLAIDRASGAVMIRQRLTTMSYERLFPLPPRTFRWWVRAINEAGEAGAWSAPAEVQAAGDVLTDLARSRHWVTYVPRGYNPNLGRFPSAAQIRADLLLLRGEGFRGVMTWSLDGSLALVPRIAKSLGFSYVVAGLYWYDQAQLDREYRAALAEQASIDAYIVGNEGLEFGPRYTRSALQAVINDLRTATGKPLGTCETGGHLLANPELLSIGDFTTTNIHPWWAGIRDVAAAVRHTANEYAALVARAPAGKPVFVRESWWPTGGGDPAATPANQLAYYRALAAEALPFAWGEAFDQPWKAEPPWGLHTVAGQRKPVLVALAALIRDPL